MCGRARCTVRVDDVGRACGFSGHLRTLESDRFQPSYNVSPGRYMPVVRHAAAQAGDSSKEDSVEPVVHCMKWGLVPSFSKKNERPDHFRMFNARSESVHLKSSFRRLLPKSRCVTTVEGFYEWKKDGPKKQPYYVHFQDGRPLVFAGLYDCWTNEEGNVLYTFTILTTRSSKSLDWLHDRMPVILPNQAAVNSWLNDDLQESTIHKLTQPYEASDLVWYPVTSSMGKPTFDNPECVKEIKAKVASDSKIAQLFGKKHKEGDSNLEHEGLANHSSQDPQLPEEEMPDTLSVDGDEDLSDHDRKSLLAGMEPDQDVTQTLDKEQHMDITTGGDSESKSRESSAQSQTSLDISIEKSSQKGGKQSEDASKEGKDAIQHTLESSPVKQDGKDVTAAKRRRLSMSPKMANKQGDTQPAKDKQSTLLSFFGKH